MTVILKVKTHITIKTNTDSQKKERFLNLVQINALIEARSFSAKLLCYSRTIISLGQR